ncbi:MAG TPA: tetratricopeptide repeat protein, partial [Candidatus Binatia bacterium]
MFLAGVVAAALFIAPVVHAQEGRESAEIRLSRAVLLYDDKKYEEATQELLRAHQLDPRNTNVIYYLALSLSAQGKHAEAEAYVRKGLEVQPKNAHLQYMLAHTLRTQGKASAARDVAESIQLDPASPIVGPSRDLLTALRTPRRGDSPFWLEATVRGQYDSNVTLEPNHRGLTKPLGPSESWGNLLALSTEYTFFRTGNWQAAGRYDFLQTLNYHNHKFDFNENIVGGRVTYTNILPSGQRYFLTGRGFYDNLLQNGKQFLARPTGVFDSFLFWDPNGSNRTQLLYQLQGENYQTGRRDENRDALNNRFGAVHYIFFDRQRYGINFGYNFDYEDAVGANWNYSGHRAVAGVLVTLPWEIRATSNFEFHAR